VIPLVTYWALGSPYFKQRPTLGASVPRMLPSERWACQFANLDSMKRAGMTTTPEYVPAR
jgi:hypothetical protein